MQMGRLIGAALVSLVPALFAAAFVGRFIGGAPQLVPLGTEDIGEGIRIGKYFVYPGSGGSVLFWVLVIAVFAIAEGAGIYYFGVRQSSRGDDRGE